jgi:hypothetical protein
MKQIRQPRARGEDAPFPLLPEGFDEARIRDFFSATPRKLVNLEALLAEDEPPCRATVPDQRRPVNPPPISIPPCGWHGIRSNTHVAQIGFSARARFGKTLRHDCSPLQTATPPRKASFMDVLFQTDHFILK